MERNDVFYEISKAVGEIEDDILMKEYPFEQVAKKGKKIKIICLLAATLGILTAGSFHQGLLQASAARYLILLGGSEAYTEVVQNIGFPVNASAVSNGIRITLESVVADDVDMKVIFHLEREDGLPLELPEGATLEQLQTESTTMYYKGGGVQLLGSGVSGGNFIDFDPTDGTLQYVQELTFSHGVPFGKLVPVHIGNIGYYENSGEKNEKFIPVFIGQWFMELAVPVKRALVTPDSSRTIQSGESFPLEGETVTISEVTISALGVQVALVVPTNAWATDVDDILLNEKEYDTLLEETFEMLYEAERLYKMSPTEERLAEFDRLQALVTEMMSAQRNMTFGDTEVLKSLPIVLTKTDGTEMTLVHYGGGGRASSSNPFKTVNIHISYEEILPVSEVESITIGEMTVGIN